MVSANVLFFLRVGGLRVSTTMGFDTRRTGQTKGPLGLWSRPQRGQGEGKGAEEQASLSLTANIAGDRQTVRVLCVRVRCLGDCGGQNRTLSLQSDSPVRPQRNRGNTKSKQAEKGSRLKQVGEVTRVEKSEK